MVNNNILLSKIVANPTDIAYSQAYSTLNLYIVFSLKGEKHGAMTEKGKELLEKLQREYFALDAKSLESIKHAVENALEGFHKDIQTSIILATVIEDILYIVIANGGKVLIKRHGKIGVIAAGVEGSTSSFSGKLEHNDIVILQTPSFAEKLSLQNASELLAGSEINEISETLAGLIHTEPEGTESAVILHYKTLDGSPITAVEEYTEAEKVSTEKAREEDLQEESSHPKRLLPHITLPSLPHVTPNKKLLLIPLIVILIIAFTVGLFMEKQRKETAVRKQQLEQVLAPAQKKYDEAVALESLNKSLALDSLNEAKDSLSGVENKFPENTPERKTVDEFLAKINAKLEELGGGASAKNQTTLDLEEIKSPSSITAKAGTLAVVDKDSGTIAELSSDGSVSTTYETDAEDAASLTEDENNYYILANNGVFSIDKKKKSSKKIVSLSSASDYQGIDTFLGNIYLLNRAEEDIEKYSSGSFSKSSYLKDGNLSGTPLSFSIDASIFVTFNDGSIKKYTKGAQDGLSIQGLTNPFGKVIYIFTDPDINNIYVLDVNNLRLVILNKNGEVQSQVEASVIKNATSFTVLESAKKAFVISGNKVSSFEF